MNRALVVAALLAGIALGFLARPAVVSAAPPTDGERIVEQLERLTREVEHLQRAEIRTACTCECKK
jgi:hypothetical protein